MKGLSLAELVNPAALLAWVSELPSTMDYARSLVDTTFKEADNLGVLRSDMPLWGLVLADRQTAGRGQAGRVWSAPANSLIATFIISPTASSSSPTNEVFRLSGLPLVIGVWLAELLTDSGCRPELKWPNDLLSSKVEKIEGEIAGREKAAGKKIGGVLVEVKPEYGRLFVYVGIGLNLESSPEGLSGSSSVRQAFGIRLGVEELARQILIRIREEFPKFWREGFLAFRARWLKFGPRVGTLLSIKTADSNSAEAKTQVGYFQGLREDGALRLLVNGIEISVCSGQVLLRAS